MQPISPARHLHLSGPAPPTRLPCFLRGRPVGSASRPWATPWARSRVWRRSTTAATVVCCRLKTLSSPLQAQTQRHFACCRSLPRGTLRPWKPCRKRHHRSAPSVWRTCGERRGHSARVSNVVNCVGGVVTYQFRPPQPAAVAQIPLSTRTPPPLRSDFGVTVSAVLGHVAAILPSLSLLLRCDQCLHLLSQHAIALFELADLILP